MRWRIASPDFQFQLNLNPSIRVNFPDRRFFVLSRPKYVLPHLIKNFLNSHDEEVKQDSDNPRVPKLRHRLEAAAEALDVSVRHLRNRIDEGTLPVIRDGGAVFVLDHVLRRYASTNHPFSPPRKRKKHVADTNLEAPPASDVN